MKNTLCQFCGEENQILNGTCIVCDSDQYDEDLDRLLDEEEDLAYWAAVGAALEEEVR